MKKIQTIELTDIRKNNISLLHKCMSEYLLSYFTVYMYVYIEIDSNRFMI